MANYLCIYPISDSHIEFLLQQPESVWDYIDGQTPQSTAKKAPAPNFWQRLTWKKPQEEPQSKVPSDWPLSQAMPIGPEINHRNVDLYHLILNGTTEFVRGGGSIFQTWLEGQNEHIHTAVDLSGDNEDFAFRSEQLPELLGLLKQVRLPLVVERYTSWFRRGGSVAVSSDYTPAKEECAEIANEFKKFAKAVQQSIERRQGLIWVSQ